MTAFAAAVEAADRDALAATLHPDIEFNSPAVFTPYRGRDAVMGVLRHVLTVIEDFRYLARFEDGDEHVLRFVGRVGERRVEGVDLLRVDADGLVTELTVLVRPLTGLIELATAMGKAIEAAATA